MQGMMKKSATKRAQEAGMIRQAISRRGLTTLALVVLPFAAAGQVPVDDDGNTVGTYQAAPDTATAVGNEDIPLLPPAALEELVGPVALYPDDLLAIVLPAAAYPLQIIEAARFLDKLEDDPTLEPDPDWDDAIVALLNYPEVIDLLNEDIDWTWQLGEAVVAQQADVVLAIESFRDRAYAAGNLKSDEFQTVSKDDGAIEITPVSDDVIYVPYYEPDRVVVYQPRPVYYYYPRAYPVYYYPYSSSYVFDRGFFWGVTTAFTIGWFTDSLHVYHHSYHGHPYYGRTYWDRWWYRQPSITVYNTNYVRASSITINRYYRGDRWAPHRERRPAYPNRPRVMNHHDYAASRTTRSVAASQPIRFRERNTTHTPAVRKAREQHTATRSRSDEIREQLRRGRVATAPNQRSTTSARTPRPTAANRSRRDAATRSSLQVRPEARQQQVRVEPRREVRHETRPGSRQMVRANTGGQVRREAAAQPRAQGRHSRRPQPQVRPSTRPEPQQQARRETRSAPQQQVRRESRPQRESGNTSHRPEQARSNSREQKRARHADR
jgi:hypothetical protein